MTRFTIPTPSDIAAALSTIPVWKAENGKLKASFKFKDFKSATGFIVQVAMHAEGMDHHPEWTNVYNKVDITLSTHDAGDRITDLDLTLARHIAALAERLS